MPAASRPLLTLVGGIQRIKIENHNPTLTIQTRLTLNNNKKCPTLAEKLRIKKGC